MILVGVVDDTRAPDVRQQARDEFASTVRAVDRPWMADQVEPMYSAWWPGTSPSEHERGRP